MNKRVIYIIAAGLIPFLLFNACCKKAEEPKIRYYMYDFYEANWLIARNTMVIKEVVINDSISCIQLTDHNKKIVVEKNYIDSANDTLKYNIQVVYDKKIFQKTTCRGIYFSEDSINYVLHFDFLSSTPRKMPFQVYPFYNIEDKGIKLDTVKYYLESRGDWFMNEQNEMEYRIDYKPEQYYQDFYNYRSSEDSYFVQMLFIKDCSFPLFCDLGPSYYYYVLSGATGFSDAQKYVEKAQKAIHNRYLILFGGASNIIPEPYNWTRARLDAVHAQNIQWFRKKGYSVHQIADSLGTNEDDVRRFLHK